MTLQNGVFSYVKNYNKWFNFFNVKITKKWLLTICVCKIKECMAMQWQWVISELFTSTHTYKM